MPKYPDQENLKYRGRSFTNLEFSEGDAPAGIYIPAASEAVKFVYSFGPEVGRQVVIPKGKILAFAGREWDAETSYTRPALKIAGTSDLPIGVAPHNVYKRRRDAFSDSTTHFLTRAYIQVPLFISTTSAADATAKAAAIKYGAAWAYNSDANTAANGLLGKYLMADANGNYQLADATGISTGKVIGQCLDIDNTLPPEGWLQFALGLERSEMADAIAAANILSSNGSKASNMFDWGAFPLGTTYTDAVTKMDAWKDGLPFLTDGYFRARQLVSGITLDNVDASDMDPTATDALKDGDDYATTDLQYGAVEYATKTGAGVTIDANGCVTVTDPAGATLFIKLKYDLANDALAGDDAVANHPELAGQASGVTVKLRTDSGTDFTDAVVDAANVEVDYEHSIIAVHFTSAVSTSKVIIDAVCLIDQTAGIPTMQDFANCFGIARILLQR